MNRVLKVISILLSYPSDALLDAACAVKAALADDNSIPSDVRQLLERLMDDLASLDLYEAQERYVYLFDRTRTLSLHLFEHVHGESRDRGQAMVDLMALYEAQGFEIDVKELPDYLPLFLEFLSTRPQAEAEDLLSQTAHITTAIGTRLKKRMSIYANAFIALSRLTPAKPNASLLADLLATEVDDPDDLCALDRLWQEEAVTFGGKAAESGCSPDRLHRQIRASRRKPAALAHPPSLEETCHVDPS